MSVVALAPTAAVRERLGKELCGTAELHCCTHHAEFLPLVRSVRPDAVILEPCDRPSAPATQALQTLRGAFPSLPILVYAALTPAGIRAAVALKEGGADDVVLQKFDNVASALRSQLADTPVLRIAADVLIGLTPLVPGTAMPVLVYCLSHADRPPSIDQIAAALAVHCRTVVYRMAAAGLPAPSALVSWCRLMLAARMLEQPGSSVEQVALTLGFGSDAALRNMCRRHTGLTPAELRRNGGLACIVGLFRQRLVRPPDAAATA